MAYPVSEIETVAECDAILAAATEERTELEYRRDQLQRIQTLGTGRTAELTQELEDAQQEYDDLTTRLAGMAEGERKRKAITEQKRLDFRVAALTDRQLSGDLGVVARIKRVYELNCTALLLTENTALRTEVTARRAVLAG